MVNKHKASRDKGAAFEREIAKQLTLELGFQFRRDLRQYQQSDRGDLIPDNDAFPFLVECKAHKAGTDCRPSWETQAHKAALGTALYPVVVWKFDHHPVKCRVGIDAVAEAHGGHAVTHETCDVTLQGLAYLAREIMARRACNV